MKVLVLGGGGREHALAWSISRSPRVETVWCAPGNGGIARDVDTAPFNADTPEGIDEALRFAQDRGIDLTVVGPEAPLVLGIVDRFEAAGLRIFGPSGAAARLEGSKCFTKEFLSRHAIPTADFRAFDDAEEAREFVRTVDRRVVVKADGLAAGKGVFVTADSAQAAAAVDAVLVEKRFGASGDRLIVEDLLEGTELTLIVLTDGETVLPLETAQDYKTAFDGHRGPNTGGMGSYSPHVPLTSPVVSQILETIVQPTLEGLRADGISYRGALYAGLMLTEDGPKLLEYNVRFGDPETQAILVRLESDLVDLLEGCVDGTLGQIQPRWSPRASVCVVGASRGYPGAYEKGKPVTGLDDADRRVDCKVFCAGVGRSQDGLVTAGGRVVGATARGDSLEKARDRAYEALRLVRFENMTFRQDIGEPYGGFTS